MGLKENMANGKNFIIAYPDDGTINAAVTWGNRQIHIDFRSGIVTLPDASTVQLKTKLEGSSQDKIRSFMFKFSSSCDLAIGQSLNMRIQTLVGGWHLFENIQCEELTFYQDPYNSAQVPDAQEFQLIASTSSKMPYKPRVIKNSRIVAKSTTHTADAYVSYFIQDVSAFDKITVNISATTKDLTYRIYTLAEEAAGVQSWSLLQAAADVVAGDTEFLHLDGAHKKLWIEAKNETAGQNTTCAVTVVGVG